MTTVNHLFSPIEGARAILLVRGVFKEAPLYSYRDRLYAAIKDGFLLLKQNEATSAKATQWRAVEGVKYAEEYNGLRIVAEPATKLKVAK